MSKNALDLEKRFEAHVFKHVQEAIFHKTAVPPKVKGICDKCSTTLVQRKDDTEAVVKERLAIFHESAEPLKAYYKKRHALIQVDGGLSKEATQTQIDTALNI